MTTQNRERWCRIADEYEWMAATDESDVDKPEALYFLARGVECAFASADEDSRAPAEVHA